MGWRFGLRAPVYLILVCLTLVGLGWALPALAGESPQLDFERDVRPLLARRCFECHGPETQESGLRLDQRDALLKGGKSGRPAVVAGKSVESRLIQVVAGLDKKISMP